ncbi:MAG: VIT domain-containing protein [Polyangiaceae bacterium]
MRFSALGWLGLGVLVGAVAVAVATGSNRKTPSADVHGEPLSGQITHIDAPREANRVELCVTADKDCHAARVGGRMGPGAHLRSSSGASAKIALDGENVITVEGSTGITLGTKEIGGLRVEHGNVAIDMSESAPTSVVLTSSHGTATLAKAKCTVSVTSGLTQVVVIRGRVTLKSPEGRDWIVTAGEVGTMEPDREPTVDRTRDLSGSIAKDAVQDEELDADTTSPGLGELRAKKPGETLERATAVRLARHRVNVRIVGAIARTEIEEVFTNESKDVLEGIFRFPLPSDAQIERLALEVDGRLVEGAFTERERASAIWRGSIVQAAPRLKQQMQDGNRLGAGTLAGSGPPRMATR